MARAHYVTYVLDEEGRPISGASVEVRDKGTSSPVAETIYAEDDDVGNTTYTNPFTGDDDGRISFFLAVPTVVDLYVTKTGFEDQTIRAVVHNLTSSTLTVLVSAVSMNQRSGVHFTEGFVGTDDPTNDETEIKPDWAEAGDLAAVAAAAAEGNSTEVPRGNHVHAHGSIASGDLHPEYQKESEKGAANGYASLDGSGTIPDSEIPATIARDSEVSAEIDSDVATHAATSHGVTDHGALTGLTDDDHTQYLKEKASGGAASEVPEHDHSAAAEGGELAGSVGIPTGVVMAWTTASPPTGWLLCQGQAVSRTTYADLFALIGTTYGAGNGTTTFNLPDVQSREVVGASAAYPLADSDGLAVGSRDLSHVHDVGSITAANHPTASNTSAGGSSDRVHFGGHSMSGSTDVEDSRPFLALHYIIKT